MSILYCRCIVFTHGNEFFFFFCEEGYEVPLPLCYSSLKEDHTFLFKFYRRVYQTQHIKSLLCKNWMNFQFSSDSNLDKTFNVPIFQDLNVMLIDRTYIEVGRV